MQEDREVAVERLRSAMAEDPRLGQLDADIAVRGERVLVTGYVVTEERRQALRELVDEHLPDHDLHDATTVAEALPGRAEAPEHLSSAHLPSAGPS